MSAKAYCSVAQLKTELNITDTTDDTRLERVIEAVSRTIDDFCGFPERQFYMTEAAVVRHFTAERADLLHIPDCVSLSTIQIDKSGDGTFEDTWTLNTDVVLAPYNAAEAGRPYTRLEVMSSSGKRFPVGARRGVKLTGIWGWLIIPETVTEACLLQAARIQKRSEAPFGIAALPTLEGAGIRLQARLDPDVQLMLDPLRREPIGVA